MNEDRLWAPWRLAYITGHDVDAVLQPPEPAEWLEGVDRTCFLCRAAATFDPSEGADRELLVVERNPHSLVMLNRFPYNNGHLLVAPRRHVGELSELSNDEHLGCMASLARLTGVYRKCLSAEGFNIGLNLGKVAGAGLPGHLHWHLVPRWHGDTNFMPVMAGIRVIPQSLDELWQLLHDADHE